MYLAAFIDFIASLPRILVTSIGPFQLQPLGRTLSKCTLLNSCFKTHLFCSNYLTVDNSCYFLPLDRNSVLGNSMPLTSIIKSEQTTKKKLFNYVVCPPREKKTNKQKKNASLIFVDSLIVFDRSSTE